MTRLVVVGGGRMGNSLVGGLLRSGWVDPGDINITECVEERRDELCARFPGVQVTCDPVPAQAAVLAVKPVDAETAARSLAAVKVPKVLSIMAGVPIAKIEAFLPPGTAVLRAMPNLPAILGAAASALAGGASAGEDDFAWAEAVLSSFGVVARVQESDLDAVTGLSGSGPAYLFFLAEALIDAGVAEGLDRKVSRLLVLQTLLGASRMLMETGEPPSSLLAATTSPAGTTAAGLQILEHQAVRAALMDAVAAAAERSRELGR